MNAQLPTPEETRPSSPKRFDTICKNETRQNIYEGVESMYKNYCDDDWDDESESEYYVEDYRTPNDDDPPSGYKIILTVVIFHLLKLAGKY